MQTRRLGGSYGGKISRSTLVAAAGAVAATETGHPVRIQLDLDSNMALGKLRGQIYVKFVIVLNQVSTKNVVHLYLFLFFLFVVGGRLPYYCKYKVCSLHLQFGMRKQSIIPYFIAKSISFTLSIQITKHNETNFSLNIGRSR